MSEPKVFWAVRVNGGWIATDGSTIVEQKSARCLCRTRPTALFYAAHARHDARLVKVTRRPKEKPVAREAWSGTVMPWAAYQNDGAVLIGSTNVAGWGPDPIGAHTVPRGLLATRLRHLVGKRVRVTLEVLP